MADRAFFSEVLAKAARSLLAGLEQNTVKHSGPSGEDISEISCEIVKSVLFFSTQPFPEDIESSPTPPADGPHERISGSYVGRELAERFRGSGFGPGAIFSSHRQVKNHLFDKLWQNWSEVTDFKASYSRLDVFFDDLSTSFITEWMRMDKALFRRRHQDVKRYVLQEKKRYATVFYRMREPAFVVDQALRLIDVNPAFEKFFGISSTELKGSTCCEIIGHEFCRECPLEEVINTDGSFSNLAITIQVPRFKGDPDGEVRSVLLAGASLGDINNDNRGGIVIIQDTTEKKKVEQELEEYRSWLEDLVDERTEELIDANQLLQNEIYERNKVEKELIDATASLKRSNAELEHFAHVVSHDLQEPLILISSFAERLVRRYSANLDGRGKDYLERIVKATRKLQDLVVALLQLSRVSSSGGNFEVLDMNEVVSEVVSDLEEMVKRYGASFEISNLHTISGDAIQIRQLFQNIISNALKYRREDDAPRVSIASRIVEDFCEITVEDNGIGFEENNLEKIFEPFVRLHGRSTPDGSGMGLATCKKIIERHGGEIFARCKPEAGGAIFVIRLPLRESQGKTLATELPE